MAAVSVAFGLFLTLVGLTAFSVSYQPDAPPFTALIPTGFGVVLMILGRLAFNDNLRKHAMHAAAAIALFGFLASAGMGLPKLFTILGGGEVERPKAVTTQLTMAFTCGLFVYLCVRSFINARKAREAAAAQAPPQPQAATESSQP